MFEGMTPPTLMLPCRFCQLVNLLEVTTLKPFDVNYLK